MLGYSVQMSLGAEEWLTVAARGNDAPLSPQGLSDTVTITVKVKGSDLTVYHAEPARRAEIRRKWKGRQGVLIYNPPHVAAAARREEAGSVGSAAGGARRQRVLQPDGRPQTDAFRR